jgi:hypothetical protein
MPRGFSREGGQPNNNLISNLCSPELWERKILFRSWAPVAHTCHPSYLEGWDQEDHDSTPTWANGLRDPISKITRAKWTGDVAQAVIQCCFTSTSPVFKP